jgi:1-phosphofructokinase
MIYTVTLNPAIDYVVGVKDIKTGTVNRTSEEQVFFGGKGINVSRVLSELGVKSVATGFIAGFTGKALKEEMKSLCIETLFTELPDGFSRINIKIKSDEETEINGQGPAVSEEYLDKFLDSLSVLKNGDVLVLAGSVPKSVPDNIYEIIMERFSGKGIKFVVDASGELTINITAAIWDENIREVRIYADDQVILSDSMDEKRLDREYKISAANARHYIRVEVSGVSPLRIAVSTPFYLK